MLRCYGRSDNITQFRCSVRRLGYMAGSSVQVVLAATGTARLQGLKDSVRATVGPRILTACPCRKAAPGSN